MIRKLHISSIFVLMLLLACHHKGVTESDLAKINAVRDGYNAAYMIATAQLAQGKISKEQWNSTVVPAGTKAHDAIDAAYLALELYNTEQNEGTQAALAE